MGLGKLRGEGILGLLASWFLGFLVSRFLGFLISWCRVRAPFSRFVCLLGFLVSWFRAFLLSCCLGFEVSKFLGSLVPKFQSSKASKSQKFADPKRILCFVRR